MSGDNLPQLRCSNCGFLPDNDDTPAPQIIPRPWSVMHGRQAVKAYVASLESEPIEWLIALYVDQELQLLAVDTVAQGDASSCPVPFWKLLHRGHTLGAAGWILVHNHPSGNPCPSMRDIRLTARLARLAQDLEMPLLDHLVVGGDQIMSCAYY